MPSFDIVSQINLQEVDNAINQARKEVVQRYDFKNTNTVIEWDKKERISIESADEFKVKAVDEVLREKLARRQVPLKALTSEKIQPGPGGRAKQDIKIRQGIDADHAREIVKLIKDAKLKVQAQIMGDQVRVLGKKRDDLQIVIQSIKSRDFDLALQFVNFRE